MRKKVLVITSILPIKELDNKKDENDILLETEDQMKAVYQDIGFHYLFVLPDINKILTYFSQRWKVYYNLKKSKKYRLKDRLISIFPLLILPRKVYFRNTLLAIGLFFRRKRLKQIIQSVNPTVIHAHNVGSSAFLAKKISQWYDIPFVVTLRGVEKGIEKQEKTNIQNSDGYIALNPRQKRVAEKFINKEITFIPHGLDELFYQKIEERKESTKVLKLVVVTRLLKLKNIDTTIWALSKIDQPYIFDIYGSGEEERSLQELIDELHLNDKIKLKGHIEHSLLPTILPQYDLFVMLSYPETLGRVYLEAMARGVPVMGAKNSGVDGIITTGKEGFIVAHNNLKEIQNVLESIFEHPFQLEQVKKNALALSHTFKWRGIVDKLYAVYQGGG